MIYSRRLAGQANGERGGSSNSGSKSVKIVSCISWFHLLLLSRSRLPRDQRSTTESTEIRGMRNAERGMGKEEWRMTNGGWRMTNGKCRDQRGRLQFLGARKWVAPSAPTEPPTAAPRRCVGCGSCPEPENPSVSFRFSL